MVAFEAGLLETPFWAYIVAAVFGFWAYSKFQSKIVATFLTIIFFLGVASGAWLVVSVGGVILFLMQNLPHGFLLHKAVKGGIKTPQDMVHERQEAMQIARDVQTEEYNSQMLKQLYKGYGWVESY